jgi:hypothetical protein
MREKREPLPIVRTGANSCCLIMGKLSEYKPLPGGGEPKPSHGNKDRVCFVVELYVSKRQ